MKVNQKQKDENRKKLIDAAVDCIIEKGYEAVTMREIARKAKLSDAAIYNYFATKEKLLFAYYEVRNKQAIDKIKVIPDFESFTLKEKLQTLIETVLETYQADREFLDRTWKMVFCVPPFKLKEWLGAKQVIREWAQDVIMTAEKKGEIPEQQLPDLAVDLFMDYFASVIIYWLKDTSDAFNNTSLMVDKSLDIGISILKGDVIGRSYDFMRFLFRHHVVENFEKNSEFGILSKVVSKAIKSRQAWKQGR